MLLSDEQDANLLLHTTNGTHDMEGRRNHKVCGINQIEVAANVLFVLTHSSRKRYRDKSPHGWGPTQKIA
jgi:hypothetical protein